MSASKRPRAVILGAGFGGLWAARALVGSGVDVLIIDRNNYHTFQALLYQVATAELDPEDISYPIRSILRKMPGASFAMVEVQSVDLNAKLVKTAKEDLPYDFLILAGGSVTHFFGVPGAQEHAFELKTLDQAIELRNHILCCFERAVNEKDAACRRSLLTFAIVGGGPTGVEFAGALSELIRGPIAKDYPMINLKEVQIILLEARERLLSHLPRQLGDYTYNRLDKMGVELRLGATVQTVTG